MEKASEPSPYPPPPAYGEHSQQTTPYPQLQEGVNPSYAMPPPVHQHPVITVQPTTIVLNSGLDAYPVTITCRHCNHTSLTKVSYVSGLLSWLLCGIMFIFAFWICCFFPFCINSCQDVEHRCGNCNQYIGTYKRM